MTKKHIDKSTPTCPSCDHAMSTDEMVNFRGEDLFAAAPNEEFVRIQCPNCDTKYWVQGGYKPQYTSAISEDDL